MKKFDNMANKINAIKEVFRDGEKLKGKDIVSRLQKSGYRVKERNVLMFIYHRMLHKYIRREVINGINVYTLG
jgi:FtsZ-interacting cell division protein ZipA